MIVLDLIAEERTKMTYNMYKNGVAKLRTKCRTKNSAQNAVQNVQKWRTKVTYQNGVLK